MSKLKWLAGIVAVLLILPGLAKAEIPSDEFELQITPSGERGVIIDTTSIAMTLAVGTTEHWANCVPVTSTGSISDIEYTLYGDTWTNSCAWNLSINGHATDEDEVAIHGLFNSTIPSLSDFEGSDVTKNLIVPTAQQVGDTNKYEGDEDLDNMGLNVERHLWLQIKTPPTTSTGAQQKIKIVITAEAAN